jgi:hypothetical protein
MGGSLVIDQGDGHSTKVSDMAGWVGAIAGVVGAIAAVVAVLVALRSDQRSHDVAQALAHVIRPDLRVQRSSAPFAVTPGPTDAHWTYEVTIEAAAHAAHDLVARLEGARHQALTDPQKLDVLRADPTRPWPIKFQVSDAVEFGAVGFINIRYSDARGLARYEFRAQLPQPGPFHTELLP